MGNKDGIDMADIVEKLRELYAYVIMQLMDTPLEKWHKGHIEGRSWRTTVEHGTEKKMDILLTDISSRISLEIANEQGKGVEGSFTPKNGKAYKSLRSICDRLRKRGATA